MKCRKCGQENAPLKKCCDNCGAFLEGGTINNVTGQVGYRTADGDFIPDKESSAMDAFCDEYDSGMGTTPDMWEMLSELLSENKEKLPNSLNKAICALRDRRAKVVGK